MFSWFSLYLHLLLTWCCYGFICFENSQIEVDSKTGCDLQRMSQLSCRKEEEEEQYQFLAEEMCEESNANCNQTTGTLTMIDQDLNCLPFPVTASEISKNQQNDQNLSGTSSGSLSY